MATMVIPARRLVVNNTGQIAVNFYNSTTLAPGAWGAGNFVRITNFAEFAHGDLIQSTQIPYIAPVQHVVDVTFPTAPLVGDEITLNVGLRQILGFRDDVMRMAVLSDKVSLKVETAMTTTQLRDNLLLLFNNKSNLNRKFTLTPIGANTIRFTANQGYELYISVVDYAETQTLVTAPSVGAGHYDVILPYAGECNLAPYQDMNTRNDMPIKGRQYRTYIWRTRNLDQPNSVSIGSGVQYRQLEYVLYVDQTLTSLITTLNTIV